MSQSAVFSIVLIFFRPLFSVDDLAYGWMEICTKGDLNPAVLMEMTHCRSMKTLLSKHWNAGHLFEWNIPATWRATIPNLEY